MTSSFDNEKSDIEYLLIDAIQHKPYKDLEKLKKDLLIFLQFKYPLDEFKDKFETDEEFFNAGLSGDEFIKNYLQNMIVDFWEMFTKEINLSQFTNDKEYLLQSGLLVKESWQNEMTIEELIKDNIPREMEKVIEEWYWELVDEDST